MLINNIYLILICGFYVLSMLLIGQYARKHTRTITDFILGGRRLGRWTSALSAGASDMSGWLLLGLPGYAYFFGAESIWLAIGLLVGTWANWRWVAPKLRQQSESHGDACTLPEFLENRCADSSHTLRILAAVVILFFFMLYTSAGLVAAGKLFTAVIGLSYQSAVIIAAAVILSYTLFGGFIAVSWTDFAQAVWMACVLCVSALLLLPELINSYWKIPTMGIDMQLIARPWSWVSACSLLAWGLGYFGQPHILARFMAAESSSVIKDARHIAIQWTGLTLLAAIIIGYSGHVFLPGALTEAQREMVFIELIRLLYHPLPASICLVGILAAIMSTADSQLLVAATVFSRDLCPQSKYTSRSATQTILITRLTVLGIAIGATALALSPKQQILDLIAYAWAGFGASFGPVMLYSLYSKRPHTIAAITGLLTGSITVICWEYLDQRWWHSGIYAMIPGFFLSGIAIYFTSSLHRKYSKMLDN